MDTWELVLVEWCNCLELSRKIQKLNDLANGEFFSNILHLIDQSKSSDTEVEPFQQLVILLNKTYTNSQLELFHITSCAEVSNDELIIFTSLLMHYICFYNRQDLLTSPCNKLTKNDQLYIKSFLENVDKEVRYTDLEEIIRQTIIKVSKQLDSKNHPCPLTDTFKTPLTSQNKFHEKGKEISKLKNCLEIERIEKADLQEELQLEVEKNKKCEILLKKSNEEISKLKNQLIVMECRTPPHLQVFESADVEKRLRKEIASLENYIEKMDKEQDNLREENHRYGKQLREWELSFTELQNKYLERDKQLEHLTCINSQQLSSINSLECHCEELNGLLEEYRTRQNANDSSLYETSVPFVHKSLLTVEENLASSVVEVQLKDAQKLNEELQNQIDLLSIELGTNKKILDSKMEEYKNRNSKLQIEANKLRDLKLSIFEVKLYCQKEIDNHKESMLNLKDAFNGIINGYEVSSENMRNQIQAEKESVLVLSEKLNNNISEIERIKQELAEVLNLKDEYSKIIESLQSTCDNLSEQKKELSLKSQINEDKISKYLFETQILEKSLKTCNAMDNILFGKGKIVHVNKDKNQEEDVTSVLKQCKVYVESIEHKLSNCVTDKENDTEHIKYLEDIIVQIKEESDSIIADNNERIQNFQYMIKNLNSQNGIYLKNNEVLNEKIKEKQNLLDLNAKAVKEYQNSFKKLQFEINILKKNIEESRECVNSEFEKEKLLLKQLNEILYIYQQSNENLEIKIQEEKEMNLSLSEESENYKKEICELKIEKESCVQVINKLHQDIDKLSDESSNLKKKLDCINIEKDNYIENNEVLSNKIVQQESLISDYAQQSRTQHDMLFKKNEQLEELQKSCEALQIDIIHEKELTQSLSETLLKAKADIEMYEAKIDKALNDNKAHLQVINSMKDVEKKLFSELDEKEKALEDKCNKMLCLDEIIDKLTTERNDYLKEKCIISEQINEQESSILKYKQLVEFQDQKLSEKDKYNEEISNKYDNLHINFLKEKDNNHCLSEQLSKTELQIESLQREIDQLNEVKEKLHHSIEQQVEENKNIKSKFDLSEKNKDDLLDKIASLEQLIEKLSLEKYNCFQENQNKSELIEQQENIILDHKKEIELKNNALLESNKFNEEMDNRYKELANELYEEKVTNENLREKLSEAVLKSANLEMTIAQVGVENNNLSQMMEEQKNENKDLISKLDTTEKTRDSILNKIPLLVETINNITLEKNNYLLESNKNSEKINELESFVSEYKKKVNIQNKELKEKDEFIEKLNNKYEVINATLLNQNDSIKNLHEQLSEEISKGNDYKSKVEELVIEQNELFMKSKLAEEDASSKILSFEKITDSLTIEKNNYLKEISSLVQKIDQQSKAIAEYKEQIEHQNAVMAKKDELYEGIVEKYEKIQLEKANIIKSFSHHTQILKENLNEMQTLYKTDLQEYHTLTLQMKHALQACINRLINEEKYVKELTYTVKIKDETILKQLKDFQSAESETNTLKNNLKEANNEKDKLQSDYKLLKNSYIAVVKRIDIYNEELNRIVKNLTKQSQSSNFQLNDNDIISINESKELDSINNDTSENHNQINKLEEYISKINTCIFVHTEKETCYLNKIHNLKEDLFKLNENYFELTQKMKEQDLDYEFQIKSLTENLISVIEKYNAIKYEHDECLKKIIEHEEHIEKLNKKEFELTESYNLKLTHLTAEKLKVEEDISKSNEMKILQIEKEIREITSEYNSQIETLKTEILQNEQEMNSLKQQCDEYESKILSLESKILVGKEEISKIRKISGTSKEEYETKLSTLQVQVVEKQFEITAVKKINDEMLAEKKYIMLKIKEKEEQNNKFLVQMAEIENKLSEEKNSNIELRSRLSEIEEQFKEMESKQIISSECEQCREVSKNKKFLEEKQMELQQKVDTLLNSNDMQKATFENFKLYYYKFRGELDKLISQKNILEMLTNKLRVQAVGLNKNIQFQNHNFKKLLDKKEAMEVISEDIMKQYNRYSKQINDIVFDVVKYYEKNCDNLLSTIEIKIENYLEKYNLEELNNQLSDLSERTADTLEQVKLLQKDLENLNKVEEEVRVQKENVLAASNKIHVEKMKEDDLKKKNLTLRQKVILLENEKRHLEKTVKRLREENKIIKENENKADGLDNDHHYKILLQEYIAYKENQEAVLISYKMKLDSLQREYEEHTNICTRTSTPFGDEHFFPSESEKRLEVDLSNLREAYSSIRIINEKLESENKLSKRLIEEHKEEVTKFNLMKEAYEKLLEENNKLMTDVDTMKYKRARDRDDFLRLLKKERNENNAKNIKQVQDIRTDYEAKLERMKDKMIKSYREEINKEMGKIKSGQKENSSLLKVIEQLKGDLFEAEQKIQLLDMERDMLKRSRDNNFLVQRDSLSGLHLLGSDTRSLKDFQPSSNDSSYIGAKTRPVSSTFMEFKHPSKINPSNLDTRKQYDERRVSTLPRTGTVIEEVTISRTSYGLPDSLGQNLQMEDEGEMFNNKYLADLKHGKCDIPMSDDRGSRVSELVWRNSLVPPHLKSSYPAEMQFCSPGHFKDDDIKTGNLPFEDSLCKLLPGDKPRKKDFGTTSYKKPGPPTPSKNGGRLSLQGNEVHPAREPPTEHKKSTPSRIKALFSTRSSSKSTSEVTSPKKRLGIFRR